MIVSDAGTEDFIDTYAPDGTQNGKIKYRGISKTSSIIYWDGSAWYFESIFVGVAYRSTEDVATPDLVTTWSVLLGSTPVPTVTAEMSAPVII
jgi:hypothetical protein